MKYWKVLEDYEIMKKVMNSKSYLKEGKSRKKVPWSFESDLLLELDLECTSGWLCKDGSIIGYHKGENESFWNDKTAVCCPYIWMLNIDDEVYYGRYLEELVQLFSLFPSDTHFIIGIHNMGYDFSFLQNVFHFTDVFGRQERHPMKATIEDMPNIEFRCTYTLTQLSLEAWGKKIGLPKAVGDLDYNIIRTPLTALTEKELGYCERDVRVMAKGMQQYIDKYGHLKDVPMTQTGEVRKVVKAKILEDNFLQKRIVKLIPKDAHMYDAMKKAFAGGYTHANFLYTGNLVTNGSHYDFASSYPAVMCSEKFPMSPFEADIFDKNQVEEKAYLMRVRYEQLRPKKYNHFISSSKCLVKSEDDHWEVDNGRVISADYLELWITEQDYLIIKASYKYSSMKVIECFSSKKDYLPKEIIDFILELYANKTKYKDVEGYEEIYNQSKQFINSLFGMCVTDFIYDECIYDDGKWDTIEKELEDVEDYLKELKERNRNRTFLAYQWGVWITAYARRNLWNCMLSCDRDIIYCDTDSIFVRGQQDFSWYNEEITNKLKKACDKLKINFEMTRPKTPKGKEKPLGVFDKEDDWTEMITLGAKKYCYRSAVDNELHLTVSGINKGAVVVLENNIENFNEYLIFDKDADGVSKKLRTYVDNMQETIWGDGYQCNYKHGTVLRPTSYSLGMTEEYLELLTGTNTLRNYLKCIG